MMFRRTFSLATAILFAGAQVAAMALPATPVAAPAPQAKRKAIVASRSGRSRSQRRAGPGWTNKHVQRMATKRRGVARNRAAHRG